MRLQLSETNAPVRKIWSGWAVLALRAIRKYTLWLGLLVGLLALILAYQRPVYIDVGGEGDEHFAAGFHKPESSGEAGFRWSMRQSAITLRGIGKPLTTFPVKLQMSKGPRPDVVQVAVRANGHPLPPLTLTTESAAYTLTIDPSWVDLSGDLRLDFSTTTYRPPNDRRDLGFILDFARVETPAGLTLPSLTQLLGLLLCGVVLYVLLRVVWLAPLPAGAAVLLFLLAASAGIAFTRLFVTLFTTRLLFTLALALIFALLIETLVRLVAWAVGWRGRRALPEWTWAGLRAIVIITVVLKVGGLLHPYAFIIDAPFHFKYITYMAEGRDWEQYFGESLALSVMPKEEWGSAKAFIPYSPFFYVVAAPLAWLPVPLAISVPVASGLAEALKGVLVFLIGLALGRGRTPAAAARLALGAGAVYAAIPATFLLQQWGNWPTQTSLWLLTFWVALTCLLWPRITQPLAWAASTVSLTLAMLAYTVSAVYTGLFVGFLVLAGWIFSRQDRARWTAVALALAGATLLAMLIYYGQYVGKILGETLPTFGKAVEEQGKLTTLRPSLWGFFTDHLASAMQSYRLAIIYALGLAGALLFFFGQRKVIVEGRQRVSQKRKHVYALAATGAKGWARSVPWQNIWLGAWLLTFPLFTLADFYVDQALKEFWYALPAVAFVGGGWLLTLLLKGRSSRLYTLLACLVAATLVWQSLNLWVFRIFFHNR